MPSNAGSPASSSGTPLGSRRAWAVWLTGLFAYMVAVFDRSSLGVVAETATQRFDIGASQFSLFIVMQLLVYALMQVPTGVLLDRFGSRAVIATGGFILAAGQLLISQAATAEIAILARVLVGIGDAMTFICVVRLIPSWFPGRQAPLLTQLTGQLGQLGQVFSAIPLTALLAARGWSVAYAGAAAVGVISAILVILIVRDRPAGVGKPESQGSARQISTQLADSFLDPGTRLGLWAHFTSQFSGLVFALMWGFPFMVLGLGVDEVLAGALLSAMVIGSVVVGPVLGRLTAEYPWRRSNLVIGVIVSTLVIWTAVLAWPGAAPLWLLILLVGVLALNGPTSMIGFDFARSFNPAGRLGSANGIVNMGGFVASLVTIAMIGVVLDLSGNGPNYTLTDFKWAFATQYLVWAFGLIALLRSRTLTRRRHGGPADHFHQAVLRHVRQLVR